MPTVDIADRRPNANGFAESKLDPKAELWSPPLAPNGTTTGHVLPPEDTIRPVWDEDPFQPSEPTDLSEAKTRFGSRRKMIAGTAIIAVLGVAGAHVLLPGLASRESTRGTLSGSRTNVVRETRPAIFSNRRGIVIRAAGAAGSRYA